MHSLLDVKLQWVKSVKVCHCMHRLKGLISKLSDFIADEVPVLNLPNKRYRTSPDENTENKKTRANSNGSLRERLSIWYGDFILTAQNQNWSLQQWINWFIKEVGNQIGIFLWDGQVLVAFLIYNVIHAWQFYVQWVWCLKIYRGWI